jgi:hypothetical protein
MKSAFLPHAVSREKRAATWFEICVILTILSAMGCLAWLGWQRQQALKNVPKAEPVETEGNSSAR